MENPSCTFVAVKAHCKAVCFLGLLAFTLLSGCSNDASQEQSGNPVRIGAVYSLSGMESATGEDIKAGIDLAVEVINEVMDLPMPLARGRGLPRHGGRKIEVLFKDNQGDAALAVRNVKELISSDKVVALLGCYRSSITAVASEQAEMLRIPFLNAHSTSPLLIRRGLKWFFRTTPDDEMFSLNFFTFIDEIQEKKNLRFPKRVALVYENGLWGTSIAQAQQRLAWKHGYQIVEDVAYDAAALTFEEELKRIQAVMPAIILQASYAQDALALMKGYRVGRLQPTAVLGMNAGFISPDFIQSLGGDSENVLSREVWSADLAERKPLLKAVNDLFRKRHNRNMTGNSARSFTATMVLADALNRAQDLSAEAIRQALLHTKLEADDVIMPWDGIRFNPETGQNILGRGIIVQVQQGRYVTVWPDFLAARPPVWPELSTGEERGQK